MSDPLAFLDGKEEQTPVAEENQQQEQQAQEAPPEPEPTPDPEPQPVQQIVDPAAVQPDPVVVPIQALKEERAKRQAIQEQLDALLYQQNGQYQEEVYDPVSQLAQQQHLLRYQLSEAKAEIRHGAELVAKAKEWALERFDADPLYDTKVNSAADPYTQIVEDYKREQILSQVTPEAFAAFQAWQQQQMQQPSQAATTQTVATQKPPMTSLKSIAQAGGVKPPQQQPVQSAEETFRAMFP